MERFFKSLKLIVVFLATFIVIEILLVSYHFLKYGPYDYSIVEVKSYEAYCYHGFKGNYSAKYKISYIYEGESFTTVDPFVGTFPLEACIFGRLYVIGWNFLDRFNKKNQVEVFFDKDNKVYFGKSNFFYLTFSLLFLIFIYIKPLRKYRIFKGGENNAH
ncbi:MAG: hypothetical protein ACPGAE_09990 [Neptuniibacter sp.]